MNKKIRNLIIGIIVLVLLIGALLLLMFLPQNETTEESSETVSVESTSVQLYSQETDSLDSIVIENESGTITLYREADDVFTVDGLDGIDLNSNVSNVFSYFASVSATQLVEEDPADLEKYGLEAPRATVTVINQDGTENVLLMGNTLPTGSGCYAMVNDDPAVYALGTSLSTYADYKLTDLVDKTVISTWTAPEVEEGETAPSEAEIRSMSITGGSLAEDLGDIPFTFVMDDYDEDMESFGLSGSTWLITSPVSASLSSTNSSTIIEACSNGLTADSVEAVFPTEEQLTSYGFDEPYATVEFDRDGEDFRIVIGNSDDNGNRYVMADGKDIIFVCAESNLPWISIDLDMMISSLIYLPYIDEVSQVDLMINGKTYSFIMELGEPEEPEEGEEAEDPELEKVYYNGELLNLDNYRLMYQYFLSAPAESINLEEVSGDLVCTITYHYHKDPDRTDTIEIYQISDRRIALGLNGSIDFTARSAYLTRMEQNIEKLLNGEEPNLDY